MFSQAHSGAVIGVDAQPVTVECHKANGLPGLALIGLARGAVKESVVRVRSAIAAAEVHLATSRLVCNLLPAELPKGAAALDLALAAALLAVNNTVPLSALEGRRFFGALSLGGGVEEVGGAVLVADLARRSGDRELLVPAANAADAAIIPGVRVIGVRHLGELIAHLGGKRVLAAAQPRAVEGGPEAGQGCLSEVRGQAQAKRALEIAAAGGHNMLMIGPPGSGKTMLARRLAGIMPALTADECIEVTRIQSAAGGSGGHALARQRPFRSPHHTASEAALCGGGTMPRPGEVTLAHRGVLFLDELPEFSRRALESLREPLEEGFIQISRAAMSLRFPADVLLIAALNPCPCGYYTAPPPRPAPLVGGALLDDLAGAGEAPRSKAAIGAPVSATGRICLCNFEQIQRYRARISGPLLDRIDLHVGVQAVSYRDLMRSGTGEGSHSVRARVARARERQTARFGGPRTNAQMSQAELRQHVVVPPAALQILETAMEGFGLSSRAVGRILKVARTLADLDDAAQVSAAHIEQAVAFRLLDRSPAPLHAPGSGAVHL